MTDSDLLFKGSFDHIEMVLIVQMDLPNWLHKHGVVKMARKDERTCKCKGLISRVRTGSLQMPLGCRISKKGWWEGSSCVFEPWNLMSIWPNLAFYIGS